LEKAVHEKHLNLLIHCEVTKNHDVLLDVINNNPNITKDELREISPRHHQFFETIYPQVLLIAYAEWRGSLENDIEEHKKSEHIKCDICNHDLEYVCKIHNKYNEKTLRIGRDCNRHFSIYNDEDLAKAIEKRKQLSRLEKLDLAHPYIQNRLVNWDDFINKEKKHIFLKIKERYLDIRDEIASLYDEYVKSKSITIEREDLIICLIDKLFNEADIERKKIIIYIEKNRNNILIPSKKMIMSLGTTNNTDIGIKWLEEDAIIKARTLHRFRDEEFSKEIIPKYNELLNHKNIIIHKFNRYRNDIGYDIVFEKNKDVVLFQKYTNLCDLCGMFVTQEYNIEEAIEELDNDSLYNSSELIDAKSIEYALGLMENKLNNNLIEIEQYYHSFNDVIWKKLKSGDSDKPKFYYITKIDKIRDKLKDILYNFKKYTEKDIYELLINNSVKVTNSDAYDTIKLRNR
jgi:hypothetical protein